MTYGKMWSWKDWCEYALSSDAIDLSSQTNEAGYIPLECNGRVSSTGRSCKTKLLDGVETKKVRGVVTKRKVYCTICGFEDWRNVARRKR